MFIRTFSTFDYGCNDYCTEILKYWILRSSKTNKNPRKLTLTTTKISTNGNYGNLWSHSGSARILPLSEITADYSGPQSDSNPIVVQCLTKTGSAHWTSPGSIWSYNPARQKCAFETPFYNFHLDAYVLSHLLCFFFFFLSRMGDPLNFEVKKLIEEDTPRTKIKYFCMQPFESEWHLYGT